MEVDNNSESLPCPPLDEDSSLPISFESSDDDINLDDINIIRALRSAIQEVVKADAQKVRNANFRTHRKNRPY
jgi:hypothetical protein